MIQAILLSGLRKSYGKTVALDGLDLTVTVGEVHGFLGPNGAGKTTAIRVLLGMLRADGGIARLLGGDPWREAVALHRRLAYVPGDVTLWPSLTGGEVIDLLARLRGGRRWQAGGADRRAALLERFDLDPTKKARAYSKGNRQKVALVAALASDAELLILDEPTSGLDPLMEAAFRDSVEEERQHGRTILLSSHILSEVEALCDRVTLIRAGRTVETGTLAQLRHLTRTSITAELAGPPAGLDRLPGVHHLVVDMTAAAPTPTPASTPSASTAPASTAPASTAPASRVRCEVDAAQLNEVLRRLVEAGVRSLVSRPPTLDELFLRQYGPAGPADQTAGPGAAGEVPG